MFKFLQKAVVCVLTLSVLSLGSPVIAQAQIIGTLAAVESQQRAHDLSTVSAAMARDDVRQRMSALGVDSARIEARISALTDSELRSLAGRIDSLPAGGDALALVGAVFLVLLILEAVGVIDIFKKFP